MEREELKHQVKELLGKEFIHESLCSCTASIFLTHKKMILEECTWTFETTIKL